MEPFNFNFVLHYYIMCFLEGTKINTTNGYIPIEKLKIGDIIPTLNGGDKMITQIGNRTIVHLVNTPNQLKMFLYKKKEQKLIQDIIVNGKQASLQDNITDEQLAYISKLYKANTIVDGKYKLPACNDKTTTIYRVRGKLTLYNFVLENKDISSEYIIDVSGKKFTSCSLINYIKYFC